MYYLLLCKNLLLLFSVMSLNLNETLARTASPENTSVMLNKPQLVDLKNIIREVFKDVIQKKDGKAEPKNKKSTTSSSSEQQDQLQNKSKKDDLPTMQQLEKNEKELLKHLLELEKRIPDQDIARTTMESAKYFIENAKKLRESITDDGEVNHVGAPPHGAKDLERNRSFVVLNLAESTKIKPSERLEEDIQSVTTILDASQLEARPITLYRVEKSDTSSKTTSKGPRPIKVVMPTAVFRRKAVTGYHENYKKIKLIKGFEKLVIRRWLNKEQRDLMKSARAELKRRKKVGEKNLVIRNFKVVSADGSNKDEEEDEQEKTIQKKATEFNNHEVEGPKISSPPSKAEDKDTSSSKKHKNSPEDNSKKPVIEKGATHL